MNIHSPRIVISRARLWYVGGLTKMPETIEVIFHDKKMVFERSQKANVPIGRFRVCSNFSSNLRGLIFCDTFAFFFGTKFGKKKIWPSVSPNKSWVGSISGMLGSILFMVALYSNNIYEGWINLYQVIFLGIIFGGFSQLGDFSESLLKRQFGLKDTSDILRGHGGILDRFDSLSIASPLTLLYMIYIGNLTI